MGPPSALALRWLCAGGEKATAPQGEGSWEAEYTYFQLILGRFGGIKWTAGVTTTKGPDPGAHGFLWKYE